MDSHGTQSQQQVVRGMCHVSARVSIRQVSSKVGVLLPRFVGIGPPRTMSTLLPDLLSRTDVGVAGRAPLFFKKNRGARRRTPVADLGAAPETTRRTGASSMATPSGLLFFSIHAATAGATSAIADGVSGARV